MLKKESDKIIYDPEKKTYTKIISPGLNKKLKYFFRIRRYPGENVKYMVDLFNKNGIKTFEILEYSKYHTVTKEIEGRLLIDEILAVKDKERIKKLIDQYVEIVTKIIKLGVYFGDFNYYNFIVKNGELYVIDLEDYRKDFFTRFRKKDMMRRLEQKLIYMQNLLNNLNEYVNGERIYKEIEKKLNV